MPLGNPIRKQNESRVVSVLATEGQTVFTVQGGYIINHISVFRNGVRLSNSEDFTAGDGSTVTLNNAANIEDRIEFHVFDRFTVQNAIIGAASTQTINGDLVLNGKLFGALNVPSINLTGIVTATELDLNGKGDISGDLNVAGVSTFQAVQGTTGTFSGAVSGTTGTFSGAVSGTTGTFSGDVSIADKIIHTGDTNTAIRFPAADTITAETAGSEIVRITSAGKLGVNYTSPVTIIHAIGNNTVGTSVTMTLQSHDTVNATAGINLLARDSSNNNETCKIQAASGGAASVSLQFHTDDSEKMRIDSSGRVLIGTTTEGNANADDLTVANSGEGGITIRTGSSSPGNIFFSDATSGAGEYAGFIDYKHSSNVMTFGTSGSERVRITTAGLVGINTSIPAAFLDVVNHGGAAEIICQSSTQPRLMLKTTGTTAECRVDFGDSGDSSRGAIGYNHNDDALKFYTIGVSNERLRIDSSGRLLLGLTSSRSVGDCTAQSQIEGTSFATSSLSLMANAGASAGNQPHLTIGKSRGSADGASDALVSGDGIGLIQWAGADGTDCNSVAAKIHAFVDDTPGSNDMPGRLVFGTTADGASTPTERMRIDSAGRIGINGTPDKAHLEVRASGVSATKLTAMFGANEGASHGTLSDNTDKACRIAIPHYDTDEEPFALLVGSAGNGSNALNFGGGTSLMNAATAIQFTTAANSTTTSGTTRMTIDGDGAITAASTKASAHNQFYSYSTGGDYEQTFRISNASTGSSANLRLLLTTYANQGADPYIKFDSGGTNFVVGQRWAGTTSNALVLGMGDNPATMDAQVFMDGTGDVKFGSNGSSVSSTSGFYLNCSGNASSSVDNGYMDHRRRVGSGNAVAVHRGTQGQLQIHGDGDCENTNNNYTGISDVSLKENIVDASSQWNDIKAVKVRKFNFKSETGYSTDTHIGVVAQELELVSPNLVKETRKDPDPKATDTSTIKSVKYSILYMKSVKALQEAMARIETLEAKVAALEGS